MPTEIKDEKEVEAVKETPTPTETEKDKGFCQDDTLKEALTRDFKKTWMISLSKAEIRDIIKSGKVKETTTKTELQKILYDRLGISPPATVRKATVETVNKIEEASGFTLSEIQNLMSNPDIVKALRKKIDKDK